MSVLKIRDINNAWTNIPALKGKDGIQGPQGPQGETGTLDTNTMSIDQKKQLANIVGIPSKTSELTNDSNFITQAQADAQIQSLENILKTLTTLENE